MNKEELECIDCGTKSGVEMRWPGYGFKNFPRCKSCGEKRIKREEENILRNFTTLPLGNGVGEFDPAYAGESFEEDE